jgi:phage terminase small subunit
MKEQHKIFVREYIINWNGVKAYQKAYPESDYDTAKVNASKLLTNTNIQEYIEKIQQEIEKNAGISRLKVVLEHKKIAFNSMAHLHNTWIKRKEFEQLTEDQKSCIESIDVKKVKNDEKGYEVEQVKIKLYDKQRALDSISKMLGYNDAEKLDITSKGEKITGMEIK